MGECFLSELFLRELLATRANRRAITVILEIILVFVVFSAKRRAHKTTVGLEAAEKAAASERNRSWFYQDKERLRSAEYKQAIV